MAEHKLIVLGNQGVGKTALITRLAHNVFEDSYTATIGMDFFTKTLKAGNGKAVKFQMWDTAGQERFQCLLPSYLRCSNIALVLYDISNQKSFEDIGKWIVKIRSERGENIVIILVGSKLDKEQSRQVPVEDAEIKASLMGIPLIETSSKTGENIHELFMMMMNEIKDQGSYFPVIDIITKRAKQGVSLRKTTSLTNTKCAC